MAGTLMLTVKVAHIFQRRFSVDELEKALKHTHLYLLTRRPRVIISSLRKKKFRDGVVIAEVDIDGSDGRAVSLTVEVDVPSGTSDREMRVYEDGAYFSMMTSSGLLHGDSWSLASLGTGAQAEVAKHEVLYVGQAFGKAGSQNVSTRTRRHETLQKIYEDHAGSAWDVFVVPLLMSEFSFTNDDHIDDSEEGPSLDKFIEYFINLERLPQKSSVDLIEHSLISFFDTPYNDLLRSWEPTAPTRAMRKMQEAGFRLLQVHLDGWGGLARFYSKAAPALPRSWLISQEIPSSPRRPTFRNLGDGVRLETRLKYSPETWLLAHGQDFVASQAEGSIAVLKVFGSEAPSIRRPPDVPLVP